LKIRPSAKQLAFLSWEFGVFFHFGIRTYYEEHKDWDMQSMPLEAFNPIELNCEQWISTIKQAGAKYAVFVAKHHDGFANWPSKYTNYSVANTPWRNGKGDVVKEFVEACRKYDVKAGIYYSPAEFGSKSKNSKEYDDYFINQISELLTNYGKIDYLWFDGCGSENHQYDAERIIKEIRTLQPEILIFNMWDPDTRWIGNEDGMAPLANFNVVDCVDFSVMTNQTDQLEKRMFLPGECDCRMRALRWFYSDNDVYTVKSLDQLVSLYYLSIGRGANLLINIGPNRQGLLPEEDSRRLIEFWNEIHRRFLLPIQCVEEQKIKDNTYILRMNKLTKINHVVLSEDLTMGESIRCFLIEIKTGTTGKYVSVYEGKNIGHKAICRFPSVETDEVVIKVMDYDETFSLTEMKLFYVL